VAMAPSRIGVPVAGLPLPEPHFSPAPVCAAPLLVLEPPLFDLLLEPQLVTTSANTDATATTPDIERNLRRPGCIVTTPLPEGWGGDRNQPLHTTQWFSGYPAAHFGRFQRHSRRPNPVAAYRRLQLEAPRPARTTR
jgi:hypothetical protein